MAITKLSNPKLEECIKLTDKGESNGIVPLDSNAKIDLTYIGTSAEALSGDLFLAGDNTWKTINTAVQKRFDINGQYHYLGTAVSGSLEIELVWTITRLDFTTGIMVVKSATNVAWSNRLTIEYI